MYLLPKNRTEYIVRAIHFKKQITAHNPLYFSFIETPDFSCIIGDFFFVIIPVTRQRVDIDFSLIRDACTDVIHTHYFFSALCTFHVFSPTDKRLRSLKSKPIIKFSFDIFTNICYRFFILFQH